VDCSGATRIYLVTPAEWDGANITFQFSQDGTSFYDLFSRDGVEVHIGMRDRLNTITELDITLLKGWFKIRSGMRNSPVAQAADRIFQVFVVI
jgi:hypothetical protein